MTDLYQIADETGIRIEYCRIPLNESLSVEDEDGDIVLMDYSLMNASASERTHLAHEIGHCIQGSFYNPYATLDIRQKHENRADRWAIQQLIPWDELNAVISAGIAEVWELAEWFDVSEDFMHKAIAYYTGPCGLSFQKILPDGCQI